MPSLIVEDGTGVANADSYASAADLVQYATKRGITIPPDEADQEILLVKAMDYLQSLDLYYMGYRTNGVIQRLLWPRTNVYFNNVLFGDDKIPPELVKVQLILAVAAQTIELFPNASGVARLASRKTVGPITVEYDTQADADATLRPIISEADALLNILFGNVVGQMRVVRG
jgi:hypothetical protein